jgi:hypothetical protein
MVEDDDNQFPNEQVEDYMIFLMCSMIMVKRYDWFYLMLKNSNIDIYKNEEELNSLPVRPVVLGNIWRLHAVSMYHEIQENLILGGKTEMEADDEASRRRRENFLK